MEKSSTKVISYLMFIFVALVWGLSFLVTKEALSALETTEVLAVRWGISMVFFIILAVTKVIKVDYSGKKLKGLLLLVLCQPCTYSILECTGIDRTTATESSIMIAAVPIIVVLENMIFLKQLPGKKAILGVLIGFTGVVLCILPGATDSTSSQIIGYLCLLGAITVGGLYNIGTGILSERFSILEISCAMAVGGGIYFNIVSLAVGNGLHPYKVLFSSGTIIGQLLFLGLGCGVLCYAMYNYNLSKFPSTIAACIQTNSINVVGVVAGILILHEPWGWYTVIGLILTITGIVICAFASDSESKKPLTESTQL
ncbi:MAG: DMT family transporter [Firmicutes bacterium]|nr:DMT family transporter [Bacillota bacterium]